MAKYQITIEDSPDGAGVVISAAVVGDRTEHSAATVITMVAITFIEDFLAEAKEVSRGSRPNITLN